MAVPSTASASSMAVLPAPKSSLREPARKRPRLSGEAYGSIVHRETPDADIALEVDHMILQYLLHQAILSCLSLPRPTSSEGISAVERCLLQVDEFQALFKRRWPRYPLDEETCFRQHLLQLVALFTLRYVRSPASPSVASLQTLRIANGERARHWIGDASRLPSTAFDTSLFDKTLPIAAKELEKNRRGVLKALNVPAEDDAYNNKFYGSDACPSLLDLLGLFVKVSALCSAMFHHSAGDKWMHLAAQWMLHACLEQYLIFGASGSDAIDEAFAWGFKQRQMSPDSGSTLGRAEKDEEITNHMFEDEENSTQVEGWQEIRDAALQVLVPPVYSEDIALHLHSVAMTHDIADFDRLASSCLKGMSQSAQEPVLVQLEKGQLVGMSRAETQDFMTGCGLDVANFFVTSGS